MCGGEWGADDAQYDASRFLVWYVHSKEHLRLQNAIGSWLGPLVWARCDGVQGGFRV